MPRVSVVIPAYNASSFIDETLASIFAQTVQDIETVVVDDGSTDDTCARVLTYGARVRLVAGGRAGAAGARNVGVAASGSDWVAFLDADDVWEPDKLERQLAEAARTSAALISTDRYNVGDRGALPLVQSAIQSLVDGDAFERLLLGNVITTSSVLLRRSVFDAVGGFSTEPDVLYAEDWDLWLRIAHDHQLAACHTPLVSYRHHRLGMSHQPRRISDARCRVIARALDLPRGRALSPATRRDIWAQVWRTNGWDAGRHARRLEALRWYAKAIGASPLEWRLYADMARTLLTGA
jgi:glycosyltransferase involved in cell wall biosynthesis